MQAIAICQSALGRPHLRKKRNVQIEPNDAETRVLFAQALLTCPNEALCDNTKALEQATKACLLSNMENWRHLNVLAAASAEIGEFERAVSIQKESMRLAPGEERHECMQRLSQYEGRKTYREAVASVGGSGSRPKLSTPQEYLERGIVHGQQQQYKEAIDDFTAAIDLDANLADAEYYRTRALVYAELGKDEQAEADRQQAAELEE
jgi:tetratricopeptide (TPR) repeat protein